MAREYLLELDAVAGDGGGRMELASLQWRDERLDDRRSLRDVAFTATLGRSSRALAAAFERRRPIPHATLTIREHEGRAAGSRAWRLTDLAVTDYRAVEHADGALWEVAFVAAAAELLPPPELAALRVRLLRVDDLLNLDVEAINLRLDASGDAPALVVDEPGLPARLVVTFPPQTIAETAHFHAAVVESDKDPKPGKPEPNTNAPAAASKADDPPPPKVPPPGTSATPGKDVARIAGRSRLVFDVPDDAHIAFTTEGLLDWTGLTLSVSPIAAIGSGPTAEQIAAAPAIRPPAATETALELPYRLVLSPTRDVTWLHRRTPFTVRGRTELWHTRLALPAPDGADAALELSRTRTAPLRAIWSDDYNPAKPPGPADLDAHLGLTAMAPNDRHQIVILTSAFHGYKAEVELLIPFAAPIAGGAALGPVRTFPITRTVPFVPAPVAAEMLMLSPLGGWLRSRGNWTPPYEVKREIALAPRLAELLAPRAQRPAAAAALAGPSFELVERKGAQLDLSEWIHVAAQGRDHYVRIVYEGTLKPFGHRAALIKVTERKFVRQGSIVGAYMIQRMFIVVREPERVFAETDRAMPFKRVRLTTRVTPDIAYPAYLPGADGAMLTRSFWVEVMTGPATRERFMFHGVGTDVAGNTVDFTVPLMFVSIATQNDDLKAVLRTYNASKTAADVSARDLRIPGQRLAFARPGADPKKRNTELVTETVNVVVDTSDAHPQMLKADVHVPQVEELLGTRATTTIRLYADYVAGDVQGPAEVFAEIAKLDLATFTPDAPLTGTKPDTLGVTFSADKAGGFATPNLGASTLTRALGPLAGKVQDAVANTFDPKSFFGGGLAKLFGTFDLAEILTTSDPGTNAPKLRTSTTAGAGGSTIVTTTLQWAPKVTTKDLVIAKFTAGAATSLVVDGTIEKTIKPDGSAGASSSSFTGTLKSFHVTVLKSVDVSFETFAFTARSGAKPDVRVELDPGNPVTFTGDLEFVEELRQALPPGLFGDGPSLDVTPAGVRAGFSVALPPLAVGVFALKDVSLGAALTLPFLDGKPVFDFNVSTREQPFVVAVAIFGGGGFFHLQLDTAGMKELEAAIEFGATASLDIGVASGSVHLMAGIYFALERKDPSGDLKATLSGYLRIGGSMSVLGLITVSVEFNLSFTYKDPGKAYGRATLTVKVKVAFFSKSVELTVERQFGGSSADPKFLDMFTAAPVWGEYAEAFA